jgi:hypothetical protein
MARIELCLPSDWRLLKERRTRSTLGQSQTVSNWIDLQRQTSPPYLNPTISAILAVLLLHSLSAIAQSASNSSPPPPIDSSQSLPDSPSELSELKTQLERQLAASDARVDAWKIVVANVGAAKASIADSQPPDTSTLEKIASGPINSANLNEFKTQLQIVVASFQTLFSQAQSNPLGFGFAPASAPPDADVTVFNAHWQSEISAIVNKANLQPFYSVFVSPPGSFSPTNSPKIEDFQAIAPQVKSKLSGDKFTEYKASLVNALDGLSQQAQQSLDKATRQSSDLQQEMDRIVAKQGKARTEINQLAIELGLPLFCATVLLMLAVPIIVQALRKSSADEIRAIFASGILVEIITVLLLTMTILILGLSSKIEGPVLGTLLGGISGYVLNRFRGKNQGDSDSANTETEKHSGGTD